ncbi:MAG: aldo/keto reductase [Chloroflexi bacterium]|nr:aldo/keto reductase [Chloroflexota bacterium]
MKYRALGSTGVQISEIVFGAGAVGGLVFKTERDVRLEGVRRALSAGINWIDTAPSYGDGQSEENLGWILNALKNATPHLSTKVRIDAAHLKDVKGEARRSIEQSLRRLQRSSVDLFQLHSRVVNDGPGAGALTPEQVLGEGGVADAFDGLRSEGLTKFTGITGLGDTAALHKVIDSGRFQTVQVYHNLLNPSAGRKVGPNFSAQDFRDLIGAAHGKGMGVLNIRVLAAGVIAGRQALAGFGPLSGGNDPESDQRRTRLVEEALAAEKGTMAQKAVRFALSDRRISGVLVGFSEPGHVDDAVTAVDMGPLSDAAIRRLQELWRADFRAWPRG